MRRPLVLGTTLMPLVAIAMIPLLVGVELIYPWTGHGSDVGFAASRRRGCRPASSSSGRSAIWSSSASSPGRCSPRRRACAVRSPRPASSSTRIIGSLIGVDFGESTQPGFHSSIYGLLALTNQWLAGISFAILLGLWGSEGKAPLAAAGVLVTAILMWGYMHAMQYIVIWAGDIPGRGALVH